MYGNMRAGEEGGEEKVSSIGAAARPVARLRYFFLPLTLFFPCFSFTVVVVVVPLLATLTSPK